MIFVARPATVDDSLHLLSWRNDPLTREQSRDTTPIAVDTHHEWLSQILSDSDRYLYVVETDGGSPVGTVRFDYQPDHNCEVSLTVNPEYRGKKYATPMLLAAEDQWWESVRESLDEILGSVTFRAFIKEGNLPSIRLFESAGYTPNHGSWWIKRLGSDV